MQAVIAIPEVPAPAGGRKASELLMLPVAGVPLLTRIPKTAAHAGANDLLLICPPDLGEKAVQAFLTRALHYKVHVRVLPLSEFDPRSTSAWAELAPHLEEQFLWLPWNWVTTKQFLEDLPLVPIHTVDWAEPAHVTTNAVTTDSAAPPRSQPQGVAVTSSRSIPRAERFLVAHSGKPLDGYHTSLNRRLCRPFVRLLSHTSVTPDQITFGGVLVSVLSAVAFARGGYLYSVLGALLFYIAGLFDEMDGMVARIKFAESPRGTWLEGVADGLSYLLLFGGITIGLSHRYGRLAIYMGILLLFGTALALVTTSLQRRRATVPDRPNEYLGRMYQLLDKDSRNRVSRLVRTLETFIRRGVLIHYVVIFTLIGALPLLFLLATLGAHLTWIVTLYLNRRFFARSLDKGTTSNGITIKEDV